MDIKFNSWSKVDKNEGGDGRYTIHISEKELAEQLKEQNCTVVSNDKVIKVDPSARKEVERILEDNQLREKIRQILEKPFKWHQGELSNIIEQLLSILPPTPSCLGEEGIEKILLDTIKQANPESDGLIFIADKHWCKGSHPDNWTKIPLSALAKALTGKIPQNTQCLGEEEKKK